MVIKTRYRLTGIWLVLVAVIIGGLLLAGIFIGRKNLPSNVPAGYVEVESYKMVKDGPMCQAFMPQCGECESLGGVLSGGKCYMAAESAKRWD